MLRWFALLATMISGSLASAAVVSIFNTTDTAMSFTVEHARAKPVSYTVQSGEIVGLDVGREPVLKVTLNGKPQAYNLEPYAPYLFIHPKGKAIAFSGVELAGKLPKPDDVPMVPSTWKPVIVAVKLFADDANRLTVAAWSQQLGTRLTEASDILEKQVGVKFKVSDTGEWFSAKDSVDLAAALADFELKAECKPTERAVGFISRTIPGEAFGASGEPGSTHTLIREAKPKAESERVEVLAHHLAMSLGAVRSPEPGSLMRVKVADGQARRADFRIQLDPLNVIVVRIWAEQFAAGKSMKFSELNEPSRARLAVLYKTIDSFHAAMKSDDVQARDFVDKLGGGKEEEKPDVKPVVNQAKIDAMEPGQKRDGDATALRAVVTAISAKAAEVSKMPAANRSKGDELTALYMQTAAAAATKLDAPLQQRAFLVGLGIGLDDSTTLRDKPILKTICRAAESDDERQARIKVLGVPSLRGRRDLCQHFVISAALTELLGSTAAEFAGLSKELSDMKGTSGFSFTDLVADHAGVEFAKWIAADPKHLSPLAKAVKLDDFMPDIKPFKEGLSEAKFKKEFGKLDDPRFKTAMDEVRESIRTCPAHKKE